MGVFGRDNAYDLMIFSDLAEGDEDDPAAQSARDILGMPRKRAKPAGKENEAAHANPDAFLRSFSKFK